MYVCNEVILILKKKALMSVRRLHTTTLTYNEFQCIIILISSYELVNCQEVNCGSVTQHLLTID